MASKQRGGWEISNNPPRCGGLQRASVDSLFYCPGAPPNKKSAFSNFSDVIESTRTRSILLVRSSRFAGSIAHNELRTINIDQVDSDSVTSPKLQILILLHFLIRRRSHSAAHLDTRIIPAKNAVLQKSGILFLPLKWMLHL